MTATSARYVWWQDGNWFLGYLEEWPDQVTQGKTIAELEEMLRDLYETFTTEDIPGIERRHVGELQLA